MDIRNYSFESTTDALLRELHEAAKTTRSAKVLAALNRAANTYWKMCTDRWEGPGTELVSENVLKQAGALSELAVADPAESQSLG